MCWIVWVYSIDWVGHNLWKTVLDLLKWNKNRWQDWYWLSVLLDDWELKTFKFRDLEKDAQKVIHSIKTRIIWIIWHARYPTSWWVDTSTEYLQPFELTHLKYWMAFAFNWNIVNAEELAIELEESTKHLNQSEQIKIKRPVLDTNVLKHMILLSVRSWIIDLKKILEDINNKIDWSCNIVLLSKDGDFAFSKDRLWFRPLSWEIINWVLMLSSESSALFKVWWDDNPNFLEAWEIVYVNWMPERIKEEKLDLDVEIKEKSCVFETIYFWDSKTTFKWKSLSFYRYKLGYELAGNEVKEYFTKNDTVVVDIPSSSYYSAQWYSERLDLPLLSWAITKNPEIWRTFISGLSKEDDIKQKYIFNPELKKILKWKKIVLIDDSIVRWSTMEYLVKAFIEFYEPAEVHLRIPSPPTISPCYYWINTKSIKEFIVRKFFKNVHKPENDELDSLASSFWANSLKYLSIEWLIKAVRIDINKSCLACLNSNYPTVCWQKKYKEQL